jgi:hypothetical protein
MATNAERQAAFRQRRDARIRELEALRNQDEGAEVAKLKRELAHVEHTLALAMNAIKMLKAQNKRLRNGEPFEIIVPAVAEEPQQPTALTWPVFNTGAGRMWQAETNSTSYSVFRPDGDADLFEASFSPWSKSRRRLKKRALGNFASLAEAKAACEAHAAGKPQDARQPAMPPT